MTDAHATTPCDMIITAGWVITVDAGRRIFRDGAVAITGSTITAVGKAADINDRFTGQARIDRPDAVIMPGMTNGHRHLLCCAKGALPEGGTTLESLRRFIYPSFSSLEPEDMAVYARHATAEMIRNGTTLFEEPGCNHIEAVLPVIAESGMRARIGLWTWDQDGPGGKPLAINANMLAAKAIIELDASRLTPELEPWVRELFGEETYLAPGRVYGGLPPGGPSMIPDECVIRLDCRPQPGVTVETVRAEVDRCLDNVTRADPRFKARVELADVKPGYLADPQTTVVQTMVEAVRQVRGTEPTLKAAGWLGDTASFGEKIPTVIFGPGGEPVYCPNERLSIEDIVEATKVYTAFATLALLS